MFRQKAIYFIVFSVFAILCVNFSMRFLTKFWIVFLLSVALGISLLFYGIKKENSPLRSDVRIKVLIWIAVSLMIQYSIGISVGFFKNVTPWTDAIYVVVLAIISEILRYILCFKSSSIRQIILIGIMFALVDVVFPIAYADAKNLDDLVEFSTIYILPSISKNFLLTYISKKVGYSPCILYRIIMETYVILFPIIPAFGDYINAMVLIVFPLILFYSLYKTIEPKNKEYVHTQPAKKVNKIWLGVSAAIFLIVVYFISGVFRFYALSIVSGSMEPTINVGDMIIVDTYYKNHVDEINLGDVLVFNKHGVAVSHRVVEIKKKENKFSFYTKGDNNESMDDWIVEPDEVIGVTRVNVPVIGYPVVIWNKVINKE